MTSDKLEAYLQRYLDNVVFPRIEFEEGDDRFDKMVVHDILKGSYQPPIIHVFIDTEPSVNRISTRTRNKFSKIEKEIIDFFRFIPIKFPVKVHWNSRPLKVDKQNYDFSI